MARKKKKPLAKVPVSKAALLARINRKLDKRGERLFARRGGAADRATMGDYYIIDTTRNIPTQFWVDPEEFARELGVLQLWEQLTVASGLIEDVEPVGGEPHGDDKETND